MRPFFFAVLIAVAACGPQLGALEKGETGRVVRAYGGGTLILDNGLRVFLAEIDAPSGENAYASQAHGELEALALHRAVQLAYGGVRRWTPSTPREGAPPPETAIAHVFVKSEGGRWFWLQHEMVSRGAAYVRPRRDNAARTPELLALENQARDAERGMWGRREYASVTVRSAARAAARAGLECTERGAPYRVVEGSVCEAQISDGRAALVMDGATARTPFSVVLFGEDFTAWDGPELGNLTGANIRVRGPLGVHDGQAQLCLQHSSQLEVLPAEAQR